MPAPQLALPHAQEGERGALDTRRRVEQSAAALAPAVHDLTPVRLH